MGGRLGAPMLLVAGTFVGGGVVPAGADVMDGVEAVMLGLVETRTGVLAGWAPGGPEPHAVSSTAAAPAAAVDLSSLRRNL